MVAPLTADRVTAWVPAFAGMTAREQIARGHCVAIAFWDLEEGGSVTIAPARVARSGDNDVPLHPRPIA